MSGIFGMTAPPAAPTPPNPANNADVQAASLAERQRMAQAQGRQSTILTGDQTPSQQNIRTNTLLGG